jgi:hypothetical protein
MEETLSSYRCPHAAPTNAFSYAYGAGRTGLNPSPAHIVRTKSRFARHGAVTKMAVPT